MLINENTNCKLKYTYTLEDIEYKNFKYKCVGIQREKEMLLHGQVETDDKPIVMENLKVDLRIFTLKVIKVDKDTEEVEDEIEVLVGTKSNCMTKAWKTINMVRPTIQDIESILEEYEIPDTKEFDIAIRKYFRREMRRNNRVPVKYTLNGKNITLLNTGEDFLASIG